MMPPLQSLSTRTVADQMRGGVLGVYQSTISLSIIVSTAISGVIFAYRSQPAVLDRGGADAVRLRPRRGPAAPFQRDPAGRGGQAGRLNGLTMTFTRDRFTWLTYFLLGFYAFYQASLSPIMPFLKDELGLNYTMSGFFFSAFALGMIAAGLVADRVRARVGRRAMLWGGAAGMAAGVLLLVLSPSAVLSITAVFLMGAIGTLIIVAVQSTLSDKYGDQRGVALAEANISAIAAAASVPLLVGAGQALGLGWRSGLLLPLAALLVFYIADRGVPVPEKQTSADVPGSEGPLPPCYWLYWLAIFLGIAAEWCVVLWTPAYLETVSGFSKTAAAVSASVLLGAMVWGGSSAAG